MTNRKTGFDPTQPIYQRADNSFEPGGLVVTYNDEQVLLINQGSPFWTGEEPEGLREEVMEFVRQNPQSVQPEPMPETEDSIPPDDIPPEQLVDAHSFVLGLMGIGTETPENKRGLQLLETIEEISRR